jgi:cytidyltransferase-like protein
VNETKATRVAVVIGRFQPFHNGHLELLRKALSTADHVLLVIGTPSGPRTRQDPWTHTERQAMILGTLVDNGHAGDLHRLTISCAKDQPDDSAWVGCVAGGLAGIAGFLLLPNPVFTLVTSEKESNDWLFNLANELDADVLRVALESKCCGTEIRKAYLEAEAAECRGTFTGFCAGRLCCDCFLIDAPVPSGTKAFLRPFVHAAVPEFESVVFKAEQAYLAEQEKDSVEALEQAYQAYGEASAEEPVESETPSAPSHFADLLSRLEEVAHAAKEITDAFKSASANG